MFDISWTEFLLIGIVALIVIGPKELPAVMRSLGQWTRKIRSLAADFQNQFHEAMREAEMADLKKHADDIRSSVGDIANFNPMASTQKEIESAFDSADKGAASEASAEASTTTSPEPAPQVEVNVPLPELPSPVSEKDFAPAEAPPPKQAGGGA
jgi:sec-independent protein translocase protein TatB